MTLREKHDRGRTRVRSLYRVGLSVAVTLAGVTGLTVTAPVAAAACPSSSGGSIARPAASGDVVFKGGGWGHGMGMSQFGAQGAARLGCSYGTILARYYAGTTVAGATMPPLVRVRMLDGGSRVDVTAATGEVRWQLNSCKDSCPPRQPKGSTWQLKLDKTKTKYALFNPSKATTPVWSGVAGGHAMRLYHAGQVVHLTTWKNSSIYLDRRLKWDFTQFTIDASALDAVEWISSSTDGTAMNKYLWGIAEMPTLFPTAALKAQAVAARTYAAKRAGRILMPTPADQNYTGYAKESEDARYGNRWRDAVNATSGEVIKSSATGGLIDALYSSSMGGSTEDERYVWGVDSPFLRAVDDSRWDLASSNPYRSWAVPVSWATVAGRLGFSEVSNIWVPAQGTTQRLQGVKVTGIRDGRLVTQFFEGWDVRQAFGLRSPGFVVAMTRIGGAGAQPVIGDWDGDGDDDRGWFRGGSFALSMNGKWIKRFRFGRSGDVAVAGDWDGDGRDSVGVFRDGQWYLRNSLSGGAASTTFTYGAAGDRPLVGRWNGKALGVGVRRGTTWYLRNRLATGATDLRFVFGRTADRPVVGDWDDNGTTTVGVWRAGQWRLRNRSAMPADLVFRYGSGTDRPVVGDWWRADGRTTVGFVRGRTFVLRNRNGAGAADLTATFRG